MAGRLDCDRRIFGWSVARGVSLCPRAGCSAALPVSCPKSEALILMVKISWVLLSEHHFSSENCFSSESANVSKIFGFCWGGTLLGTLLICWDFYQGRLLHFSATAGTREGRDPAAGLGVGLGLSQARQVLRGLGCSVVGSGGSILRTSPRTFTQPDAQIRGEDPEPPGWRLSGSLQHCVLAAGRPCVAAAGTLSAGPSTPVSGAETSVVSEFQVPRCR